MYPAVGERSEPIEVTDYPKNKKERQQYIKDAKEKLGGSKVYNSDAGFDITFSRKKIEHAFRGSFNHSLVIGIMTKLVEEAKYLGAERNVDDSPKKQKVRRVHQFVNSFKVEGRNYNAIITIFEYDDGKYFYNNASIAMPSSEPGNGTHPHYINKPEEGTSFNTKSSILKLTMDSIARRAGQVNKKTGKILFQEESKKKVYPEHVEKLAGAMEVQAEDYIEPSEEGFWNREIETPAGKVKFGKKQKDKLDSKNREQFSGLILPTLQRPDVILKQVDKKNRSSLEYHKVFKKRDGHTYFLSVSVPIDGERVVITNQARQQKQMKKAIESGELAYAGEKLKQVLPRGLFPTADAGFRADHGAERQNPTLPANSPSTEEVRSDDKSKYITKRKGCQWR